jgi:hypothetical protein
MQHDRNAAEGLRESVEIPKINLSKINLTSNRSQVAYPAGGEIINDTDGVPVPDKSFCQMRTDKSGSARDRASSCMVQAIEVE